MVAITYFIFCASVILVKEISSQYIGPYGPSPIGPYGQGPYGQSTIAPGPYNPYGSYGPGLSCPGIASNGGGFPVTSFSSISPTGLTLVSENVIEGQLGAGGQLPFLGTVALEGAFPTAGVGAISYSCGSGAIGITSEGPIATGILAAGQIAPGLAGPYGNFAPIGGCGCA